MLEPAREVLAWAAVFNHALTVEEVRQHLAAKATLSEVLQALNAASFATETEGRWHLASSSFDVGSDANRRHQAKAQLDEVGPVLSQLAASPAVEAMAITGSVAAGVNDDDGDVDLLIVARPGHVWRVRALAIHLQHNVAGGDRICPNMVLDRRDMELRPSVYAARELAMMRPLKGKAVITKLIEGNPWFTTTLPNASMRETLALPSPSGGMPWWWPVMRAPLTGRWAERWESDRRIRELESNSTSRETTYAKDRCIGHENAHRSRIEQTMARILEEASE